MKNKGPEYATWLVWQQKVEAVATVATCWCGHVLKSHGDMGCNEDCVCGVVRDSIIESHLVAVDEF